MEMRTIREIRPARASRDGDGVAIQRVAGMAHAGMDPILMIDELCAELREDYIGGFPPHPHRGMQTITYLKNGGLIHEDSEGNRGEIRGGGAQWMSAGRGIIHSEMPTLDSNGLHGFQLWVNLPAVEKMSAPRYRDIPGDQLVHKEGEGFDLTAISGRWQVSELNVRGPLVELESRVAIVDLNLRPGGSAVIKTSARESVMGYLYRGSILHAGMEVAPRNLLITDSGTGWRIEAAQEGASLLLLRGEPLAEPVAHYGPFVMNTRAEIEQAIQEYQSGQFIQGVIQ